MGIIPAAVSLFLLPSPNENFKLEFRNTVKKKHREKFYWLSQLKLVDITVSREISSLAEFLLMAKILHTV